MGRIVILAALLASAARADLKVEYGPNSAGVFYRDGEQVYYEQCAKRGCSGNPTGNIASVSFDTYVRGIQTFYSVNDTDYGGAHGGETLDRRIEELKSHLASPDLKIGEIQDGTSLLKTLVTIKEREERAHRDILQFLEAGNDNTLNQQFQVQRGNMAALAFYRIGYLAEKSRLYRLSAGTSWQEIAQACSALGSDWSVVSDARSIASADLRTLAHSALMGGESSLSVWTSFSSEPGYNVTCGWSCSPRQHDYKTTFYPVAAYHDKARSASISNYSNMTICRYTNGCATGEQSEAFVPRKATVATISETVSSSEEDVEVGENSPGGSSHYALCSREFKMDNSLDNGGDNLVSLSLYDLDASLERIAKAAYANRATFLREVNKAVIAVPLTRTDDLAVAYHAVQARAFVLNALSPVLHDMETPFMTQYVLPDYDRTRTEWNHKLKITSIDGIELLPEVYHLALVVTKASLDAVKPYLTAADSKQIDELIPVLGRALAGGKRGLPEVNAALAKNAAVFQRLSEGRRTRGFGQALVEIASYLQKKADE